MNFDSELIITIILFLCGALFLCAAAIFIYALIVALELRRRSKALKDHPNVIREWPPDKQRAMDRYKREKQ